MVIIRSRTDPSVVFTTDYAWLKLAPSNKQVMRFPTVDDARELARNTFNWRNGQPPLTDAELDDKFTFESV